ncbi:MAG: flagellin FliC3 [Lachnospiraceae bacterium]|nr:flagellin FliC3 [Lachnospiraceae bacterium]
MKVNSNIQAMIASNVLKNNENRFSASSERMSSGYKINRAKDNPAGMAITNRMHSQLESLNRANQNSSNAVNVIQTAEGALSEVQDMLQRMKELTIQAANGTNTTADREAIQSEIDQLTQEITRISKQTEYNSQKLLNGDQDLKGYSDKEGLKIETYNDKLLTHKSYSISVSRNADGNVEVSGTGFDTTGKFTFDEKDSRITYKEPGGAEMIISIDQDVAAIPDQPAALTANLEINGIGGMKIQVGAMEGQSITMSIPEISLENLGINRMDVRTEESAKEAIDLVDEGIAFISKIRSRLGAYQNRLEATISNLDISEENLTSSYSTIKDVDMAEEMVEYTKLQILTQAGTTMLTQANEQPQQALQLLQS